MGKKRGFCCSDKENSRRRSVSLAQARRWNIRRAVADHKYASSETESQQKKIDLPDISFVGDDVTVGQVSLGHTDNNWAVGRRIVELGVLAEALKACKMCGTSLHLHHTMGIQTYGLAAILKIPCSNTLCGFTNNVPTGKRHGEPARTWDVNSKLGNALIHAGGGVTQFNSICAALNIPPVHHKLLNNKLAEVGPAVETVAKESIEESLKEECVLTERLTGEHNVCASVDAGWQKRGSGKAYDSLSGHATMIGTRTGKVIGYSVRSKTCRICSHAENSKTSPRPHDCRRNWKGSSKAMEQDMVVEMVKVNKAGGVKTSTIIGDDDATTISRLRQNVDSNIEKRSDKNHVKKNLANHLYLLQHSHKSLSSKVIRYIQKCWNYMIAQNVNDPDGICVGLDAMSKHPFGDHSLCGDWCNHKENLNLKFKSLPYGKCLTDRNLQSSLAALFRKYAGNCQKLSEMGSTQANESLNMTIASKAPKRYHFSGSASLNYRVAAGVAQKNIGHGYVSKVNAKIGLSPGVYTKKVSLLRDLQHRKRKAIACTRQAKKKRIDLRANKLQSNAFQEKKEGTTYLSEVDLCATGSKDVIPPPRFPPSKEFVDFIPESHIPVYFDLETTGLGRCSHIIQMAAEAGTEKFNCFVYPKVQISSEASRITGISIRNGKLTHLSKEVEGKTIFSALDSLLAFLYKFQKKVLIVGHNIHLFDCPIFLNALVSCHKIDEFSKVIDGFLDTLKLFKLMKPGLSSYKQEHLCNSLANVDYDAHDARGDVSALQKLLIHQCFNFESTEAKSSSLTFKCARVSYERFKETRKNLPSLQPLIEQKVISVGIARKLAGSVLNYHYLHLAFKRNPTDGISDLCREEHGGLVRVTKCKRIIDKIVDFFINLSKI